MSGNGIPPGTQPILGCRRVGKKESLQSLAAC